MIPKDKAIELYCKYIDAYNDRNLQVSDYKFAKQCVLIAVDELIKYHDEFMDVVRYELPSNIVAIIPYKYWDEVKQEIEKL